MKPYPTVLITFLLCTSTALGAYQLAKEYSGQNFFHDWDFYGAPDNTTSTNATALKLALVDDAGNAIIRVDNTMFVPWEQKRDSIISPSEVCLSSISYTCLWVLGLPFFCTKGPNWPDGGEIDIIETVNLMTANQCALHTGGDGCLAPTSGPDSTGKLDNANCSSPTGYEPGCPYETASDNVGQAFASADGGVYAAQFDMSGIYIWFWSRANVPSSVSSATNFIDTSSWGKPSAAYPSSSCDVSKYFAPQQLVLDITLCGNWAGGIQTYEETCPVNGTGDANICYINNVINNGKSAYANAYFEISYLKAFTANATVPTTATNVSTTGAPTSKTASASGSASLSSVTSPSKGRSSGAMSLNWEQGATDVGLFIATVVTLAAWALL